jgi:hypothetical protein
VSFGRNNVGRVDPEIGINRHRPRAIDVERVAAAEREQELLSAITAASYGIAD